MGVYVCVYIYIFLYGDFDGGFAPFVYVSVYCLLFNKMVLPESHIVRWGR